MLDEENPTTLRAIYHNILKMGAAALPILKEQYYNSFEPLIRERLLDLIVEINFQSAEVELLNWKWSENHDMGRFLEILDTLFQTHLRQSSIEKYLNTLSQRIWIELNANLTALETIGLLNHIFFQVHKTGYNKSDKFVSDIVFIPDRNNKDKLHPIVFASLYLGVCQRLKLPVHFVDIPGGYIMCYTTNHKPVKLYSSADVLFFISPLDKGIIFDSTQLREFLESINFSVQPHYFVPRENIILAKRLLHEIGIVYEDRNDYSKKRLTGLLLEILTKPELE